jgi:Flp pilus assembly protein TadD
LLVQCSTLNRKLHKSRQLKSELGVCRAQHQTDAAVAAAETGDFSAAVASFRLALQLDPKSAALHEQLAQCLIEMEQHDAALQAAEAATALQPDVSLLKF